MLKKNVILFISLSLLISCSSPDITNKNYSVKNLSEIYPMESASPSLKKQLESPYITSSMEAQEISQVPERGFKFYFDSVPDERIPTVPGAISVILKNDYKIRAKDHTKLFSKSSKDIKELESILEKNKLIELSDMSLGKSEEDIDEEHKKTKKFYGDSVEIPDSGSMHTYIFSEDSDTKKIAKELRTLSCVRTAYPSIKIIQGGVGNLSVAKQTPANYSYSSYGILPNDPEFHNSIHPESTYWWWFNRHKIFQAWDIYGQTPMPKIAVLDGGFDTKSFALDRPNYLSGYSITCNPSCSTISGNEIDPITSSTTDTSHGTEVASIIGSERNNNQGLAGIAHGASILPIRLNAYGSNNTTGYSGVNEVVAGINLAVQQGVDVIEMSLQTSNLLPITVDMNIAAAVANAISSGTIVVIIAGNDNYNNLNNYYIPDAGEIVVGGSMNDPTTGKSSAYNVPGVLGNGSGSAYGDRVDLAAGAYNIYTPTFDTAYPNDPTKRHMKLTPGTSFAAPMVAATAGMVKMIAKSYGTYLNPTEVRKILVHSSTLARYTAGYTNSSETKFLGRDLSFNNINPSLDVGMRDLNVYNAIAIGRDIGQNNAISRVSNGDDTIWSSINYDWNNRYGEDYYGYDSIYKLSGMVSGDKLTFCDYNSGGGYAFSYQVLKRVYNPTYGYAITASERFNGVQGVTGADNNNQSFTNQWVNSTCNSLNF